MNSKEALERIETMFPFNKEYKSNYYAQFSSSIEPFYKDFNIIKQDLDRLEKLEKTIEILKDRFDITGVSKYKGNHIILCTLEYYDTYYFINKEQYELLKEVLNDD